MLLSIDHMLQIVALLLIGVFCACGLPAQSEYADDRFPELHYRDVDLEPSDQGKPVREDGLGSLLLKNMRFRDLNNVYPEERGAGLGSLLLKNMRFRQAMRDDRQLKPISWILKTDRGRGKTLHNQRLVSDKDGEEEKEMYKRADLSVSRLAEILGNLKARNVDDMGVKLQSLRFGK